MLEWFERWEPIWLFMFLGTELVFSGLGLMVLAKRLTQRKVYKTVKKDFEFEHLGVGEGK